MYILSTMKTTYENGEAAALHPGLTYLEILTDTPEAKPASAAIAKCPGFTEWYQQQFEIYQLQKRSGAIIRRHRDEEGTFTLGLYILRPDSAEPRIVAAVFKVTDPNDTAVRFNTAAFLVAALGNANGVELDVNRARRLHTDI